MYVSTQIDLEALVCQIKGSPILAIDTEFMREKTYYANLCLIQIATDEVDAIIDPLAVDDLTVLSDILADPETMKVFHAGSQDLEILRYACGVVPAPVFDTQVAASLLGHPQQIGYGSLVNAMCGISLAKADSYTDWSRRPLSATQLEYAVDDVLYLPGIYRKMVDDLVSTGRLEWLSRDFNRMTDPSTYEVVHEEMWRRVKRVSSLSRHQLSVVREVAAWRERTAQERNLPRKWVLPDEAIVEIARRLPKTREALFEVRGLSDRINHRAVSELLAAVDRGVSAPQESWPSLPKRKPSEVDLEGPIDLMAALVHLRAKENNVTVPLLASRDELTRVARGERDGVAVLEGWRRDLVGEELLELLDGKLCLKLEDGALKVTRSLQAE